MSAVLTQQVCSVALKRPAHQISVYSDDSGDHTADRANDGVVGSVFGLAMCAKSKVETNLWWVVDLGIAMKVTKVILTNSLTDGKRKPPSTDLVNLHLPLIHVAAHKSYKIKSLLIVLLINSYICI